jgi:SAM-dependent methyltransferase
LGCHETIRLTGQDVGMAFHGVVDSCTDLEVRGWAWDSDRPDEPLTVDVSIDGVSVASVIADMFGADLAMAGMGNGSHRFILSLQGLLPVDGRHSVSVSCSGQELDNNPTWISSDALDVVSGLSLRDLLAVRVLRGAGIEIGALNNPQRVSATTQVTYVDHLTNEELVPYYSEIDAAGLVPVGRIDDGETLATFDDDSVDFVVANNFLEHCEDTIGTLRSFMRVLKVGGVMLVTLPCQRKNVDWRRQPTTTAEFIADHEVGPHTSRAKSYDEWVRLVVQTPPEEADAYIAELTESGYRIHFHVFTEFEVMALLKLLKERYNEQFVIEGIVNDKDLEVAFAVRKVVG